MSFARSFFNLVGEVISEYFKEKSPNQFDYFLLNSRSKVNSFNEIYISPNRKMSQERAEDYVGSFSKLLAENQQQLSRLEHDKEIAQTEKNKYRWRLLDSSWEVRGCIQFIFDNAPHLFSKALHNQFEEARVDNLNNLLLALTKKEVQSAFYREDFIETLAKLYLYCDKMGKEIQLAELKIILQSILVSPIKIIHFYREEIIPYPCDPDARDTHSEKMTKVALNTVRNIYIQAIDPQLLRTKVKLIKANSFLHYFILNDKTTALGKLYASLDLFNEINSPLRYSELMACIELFNLMSNEVMQKLPSLIMKNIILFYMKQFILKEAADLFSEDTHFMSVCENYSPYNPEFYFQFKIKFCQSQRNIQKTKDLLQIIIFTQRRIQLFSHENHQTELLPIYTEAKEEEKNYRAELADCNSRLIAKPKERKESKEPLPLPERKIELKKPVLTHEEKSVFLETRMRGTKSIEKGRLFHPDFSIKDTEEVKKVIKKNPKNINKIKVKAKHLRNKTHTTTITRELFLQKQKERQEQIARTWQETYRQKKINKENKINLIMDSLERYRIKLPTEAKLPPAVLKYAKLIAPLGLAFIHGGSAIAAIRNGFGESKEEDQVEIDIDIMTDINVKLESVFDPENYRLRTFGENITTIFSMTPEPNCSVQSIKILDLSNAHTIKKSTKERDFTVSTFFFRYIEVSGEVHFYSPYGDLALKDLQHNRLSPLHPEGFDGLFKDNPICILRTLRYILEKRFIPPKDIGKTMMDNADNLIELVPPIITSHLTKLLMHGKGSCYIDDKIFKQLFQKLFPQFISIEEVKLKLIFENMDKYNKANPDRPKFLTQLYAALLMAQCLPYSTPEILFLEMEKASQTNSFIKSAFSSMTSYGKTALFKKIISIYSALFEQQNQQQRDEQVNRRHSYSLSSNP